MASYVIYEDVGGSSVEKYNFNGGIQIPEGQVLEAGELGYVALIIGTGHSLDSNWGLELWIGGDQRDCSTGLQTFSAFGIGATASLVYLPFSGSECNIENVVGSTHRLEFVSGSAGQGGVFAMSETGSDADIWRQFWSTGEIPSGVVFPTNARILRLISPESGTTTASTTVDFEYTYYVPESEEDVLQETCIRIDNLSTMSHENIPNDTNVYCENITYGSVVTETITVENFTENNMYRWRASLRNSDGNPNTVVTSLSSNNFSVVSTPAGGWQQWGGYGTTSTSTMSELTVECDPESSAWSRSICNVAIFLFVPTSVAFVDYHEAMDLLPEKFPFSWFYAISETILDLEENEEENFQSFTLDLSNTAFALEIDILSTTTVDRFLGEDNRILIRDLIGYVLWLAFGISIYFTVRSLFSKT